jgi:ankyrin repeat protein
VLWFRIPLHYAAGHTNYQCVVSLVGCGSAVNKSDTRGCSPLHYAAAADLDAK